jgi:hypothetical protein
MPSGYEKSPDYGGPEPHFGGWLAVAIGLAVLAAMAGFFWWLF